MTLYHCDGVNELLLNW